MLEDLETAPLSDAEKALFRFLDKVNRESEHIQLEDVEAVKARGWSDEALYDAITVCSLFNFYNRWADATGVREHPTELYERSGERLAEVGYFNTPRPPPPAQVETSTPESQTDGSHPHDPPREEPLQEFGEGGEATRAGFTR